MNTFFFGYLSLRWRRLARVLSFLFISLSIFYYNEENLKYFKNVFGGDYHYFFTPFLTSLTLILLISYIIKPFVVKED